MIMVNFNALFLCSFLAFITAFMVLELVSFVGVFISPTLAMLGLGIIIFSSLIKLITMKNDRD